MSKLSLSDPTNLINSSAIATLAANNRAIERALEKTLSRDGTSPNEMGADLDMDSNRIYNLPVAGSSTEPIRKSEFDTAVYSIIHSRSTTGVAIGLGARTFVVEAGLAFLTGMKVLVVDADNDDNWMAGTVTSYTEVSTPTLVVDVTAIKGSGSVSNWVIYLSGPIVTADASSIVGEALTGLDDTNVTLTFGGTPSTALLQATQLVLGWTGQLSAPRGGTGFGSYTVGDVLYADTTASLAKLAGNTTATKKFLTQTGTGSASAAPAWGQITFSDLLGTIDLSQLPVEIPTSIVNDTNLTASISGNALTLSWAGQLSAARGGTGFGSYTIGDLLYADTASTLAKLAGNTATSHKFLKSIGSGSAATAPIWATLDTSDLPVEVPTSIVNDTNVTASISGNVLTIGWSGQLALSRGGTGANLSATGGTSQVLKQTTAGAAITVGQVDFADLSGTISAGQLPVTIPTSVTNDTNVTASISGNVLTIGWSGQLSAARGGTGIGSYTLGDTLYASGASALSVLAGNTSATRKFKAQTGNGSVSAAPVWVQPDFTDLTGTISAGQLPVTIPTSVVNDTNVTASISGNVLTIGWSGALGVTRGGTGTGTYTLGDVLYSDATNSLAKLSGNTTTTNKFLRQTGTGTASAAPAWDQPAFSDITGTISTGQLPTSVVTSISNDTNVTASISGNVLTISWSGQLATTRGGTGIGTYTLGDTLYSDASNSLAKLSGNTSATRKFKAQTGTGTVSAAPVWVQPDFADLTGTISSGQLPVTIPTSVVNDTNVTASISGNVLTLSWTGQLSAARGGTGIGSYTLGELLYASGSSALSALSGNTSATKKFLSQTGNGSVSAAPAWGQPDFTDLTGTISAGQLPVTIPTSVANDTNVTASISSNTLTISWAGTLSVARGGLGTGTYTLGDTIYSDAANSLAKLAGNTSATRKFKAQTGNGSVSAAPVWVQPDFTDLTGTISSGQLPVTIPTSVANDTNVTASIASNTLTISWSGTLAVSRGGTGTGTYTLGDVLYSDAANSLAKLGGNTTATKKFLSQTGNGSVSAAPAWGQPDFTDLTGTISAGQLPVTVPTSISNDTNVTASISGNVLTLSWSGTLAETRGGTGLGTYTLGDLLYSDATNSLGALAGNTTTTKKFLSQTGNGSVSAAPAWGQPAFSDLTGTIALGQLPVQVPTSITNDTNVTASISSNVLTLSWAGTLAVARGGTGTGTYTLGDTLYSDASNSLAKLAGNTTTTKKFLSQTGNGSISAAPSWGQPAFSDITGTISTGQLPVEVPTSIVNDTNVTASISSNVLTISWSGQLSAPRGGTGIGSYAVGDVLYASSTSALSALAGNTTTTKKFLSQTGNGSASAAPAWGQPAFSDITGSISLGQLPAEVPTSIVNDTNVTASITSNVLTIGWSGQLSVARGGTGVSSSTGSGSVVLSTSPVFTTGLTTPLVIGGSAASSTLTLESTSGTGTTDAIIFKTGSQTERLRIDTNGNFLGGYSSVVSAAGLTPVVSVAINGSTQLGPTTFACGANTNSAAMVLAKTRGGGPGTNTIVVNGDTLGALVFAGNDGATYQTGAAIAAQTSGTLAANTMPTQLIFQTATTTTLNTRMIIQPAGDVQHLVSMGYGPASSGVGGTVTQVTSITTGVTLNKICGAITTVSWTPTPGTPVSFTLTNSTIAANDVVVPVIKDRAGQYAVFCSGVAAGSCTITINPFVGTTQTVTINFVVIKSVTN